VFFACSRKQMAKKRQAPHMITGLAISVSHMYTAFNCSPKSIHSLNSKFKTYWMLFEDWCRCSRFGVYYHWDTFPLGNYGKCNRAAIEHFSYSLLSENMTTFPRKGVASLYTPAFLDILAHEEQKNQRACEIELLACCTSTVWRLY
jgi:hypothetical protein